MSASLVLLTLQMERAGRINDKVVRGMEIRGGVAVRQEGGEGREMGEEKRK